jgi:hypothetical protein
MCYSNFSQVIDDHLDELAYRKHGYIDRLIDEYAQRFPESPELKYQTATHFLKCYRVTHDEIPRIHGPNYKYYQAWLCRQQAKRAEHEEESDSPEPEAAVEADE